MYLELGVDASQIKTWYPTDSTQEQSPNLEIISLRGYHPLRHDYSKSISIYTWGLVSLSYNTTSSIYYYTEFSLFYVGFARRY